MILLILTIVLKIFSLLLLFLSVLPQVYREIKSRDMLFSIRIGLLIFVIDYTFAVLLSLTEDILHITTNYTSLPIIIITVVRASSFFIGTVVLHFIYHQHYLNKD